MNVEKTNTMRISWQLSPIQILAHQKQLEDVEYLSYLGSIITNDARHAIISRIAMAKAAFSKMALFSRKLNLNLSNKLLKCYNWSTASYGAETSETLASRWNNWEVLKCGAGKDDHLNWSCEKFRSISKSQGQEYPTNNKGELTELVTSYLKTVF